MRDYFSENALNSILAKRILSTTAYNCMDTEIEVITLLTCTLGMLANLEPSWK